MSSSPLSDEDHPTHGPEHEKSPGVLSSSLPYPDPYSLNFPPDPKKKSHARKQPKGHIPRPRNAFILFRCDFVRQKKIPDHLEANHRNISRIVGSVWTKMTASQKAPWIAMAAAEKKNHAKIYPDYKYHPGSESRGRDTRIKKVAHSPVESSSGAGVSPSAVISDWTHSPSFTPPTISLRRSSSCPPPGAYPVIQNTSFGHAQANMLGVSAHPMTRDDLARRPSRTIMYQSTAPLYSYGANPTSSIIQTTSTDIASPSSQWWATDPNSGSPLTTGPYSIAPPRDAPGWDAGLIKPNSWYMANAEPHAIENTNPCDTNDVQTSTFADATSHWDNQESVPTFTDPFGSGSGLTSINDAPRILAWNLNHPSLSTMENVCEQGTQAQALAASFDSVHHIQQIDQQSGAYSVDDLDSLFQTRMSLVQTDPTFPKTQEHDSTDHPQFYWGTQLPGPNADIDLLPIPYHEDENRLYYKPLENMLQARDEEKNDSLQVSQLPSVYPGNEGFNYANANKTCTEEARRERRVRNRIRPHHRSYLSSSSLPSSDPEPPTTPSSTKNTEPSSFRSARRPLMTEEDHKRLAEDAGLLPDQPIDPETFRKYQQNIKDHYMKKIAELEGDPQGGFEGLSEE
ncbi:hypothetical protein FB446DRAFT_453683 [Lentinula raphanica]|nr:hypothetical protein FB446DRAFT_453683 [Lentinula raphanica]